MFFKIRKLIGGKDILPNVIETYPKEALIAENEEEFFDCLIEKQYNVVCYHCTRLTDEEISVIRNEGLSLCNREMLVQKILNLPNSCNWLKQELIDHVKECHLRAKNTICASCGFLDWENDPACNKEFVKYWGGETIYTYYCDNLNNTHFKRIYDSLERVTHPCIVVLRVPARDFYRASSRFYENLKDRDIRTVSSSVYLENRFPEIIDVIKLDFEGFEYS